jgi:methionyl-tRNA formyltransferase
MNLVFAGTPAVAARVMRELAKEHNVVLAITRPDAPVGRKRELVPSEVATAATELGIPLLKTDRIGPYELQAIESAQAKVAIVVAFGSLIPETALKFLPWWNLHFSLLPLWRGASPLQMSLISQTGQGVTLFEIDEGLDTGPILASSAMDLPSDVPAGELLDELSEVGINLIQQSLLELPSPKPQQGQSTHAPKLNRSFAKISFSDSASQVQRKVYALNPEPMAWCLTRKGDLRILACKALGEVDWDSLNAQALPVGQLELSGNHILVVCGGGSRLELLTVQPAGGKPMSASDWFRGYGGSHLE